MTLDLPDDVGSALVAWTRATQAADAKWREYLAASDAHDRLACERIDRDRAALAVPVWQAHDALRAAVVRWEQT